MIQLHVTVYADPDGDRFKVMVPDEAGDLIDLTEQYDVAACMTEDGRPGFTVVSKEPVETKLNRYGR